MPNQFQKDRRVRLGLQNGMWILSWEQKQTIKRFLSRAFSQVVMKDDAFSLFKGVWLRGQRGCNGACVLFTRTCAWWGVASAWRKGNIFLMPTETPYGLSQSWPWHNGLQVFLFGCSVENGFSQRKVSSGQFFHHFCKGQLLRLFFFMCSKKVTLLRNTHIQIYLFPVRLIKAILSLIWTLP